MFFLVFCQLDAATNPKITPKSKIFEKILKKSSPALSSDRSDKSDESDKIAARPSLCEGALGGLLMNYCISSSNPVTESIINPLTTTSLGMSGWVLMVLTVLRTEVGVSLNPSNQ